MGWPTSCSARSTPPGGSPSPYRAIPPTSRPSTADAQAFTYDSDHGYWYLARRGTLPGLPFRVRVELHHLRARGGTSRSGQPCAGHHRRGAQHRPPGRCAMSSTSTPLGTDRRGRNGWWPSAGSRWMRAGPPLWNSQPPTGRWPYETWTPTRWWSGPGTYDLRIAHHASDPGIATTVELAPDQLIGGPSGGG